MTHLTRDDLRGTDRMDSKRDLEDENRRLREALEACAAIADGMAIAHRGMGPIEMRSKIAAAIRARIKP